MPKRRTLKKQKKYNYFNMSNNLSIIGSGGYGLIIGNNKYVIKLLYDTNSCKKLENEYLIQLDAQKILNTENDVAKVPKIYSYTSKSKKFRDTAYLCGIAMERILGLPEYNGELIHLMFGCKPDEQLNVFLGRTTTDPIGLQNPSRGFFASPEKIIDIWDSLDSQWTIDAAANIIGRTCRLLIDNGIVPVDLEFVYGIDDQIYVMDFGLCRYGTVNLQAFLESRYVEGLASEQYIPQEGQLGREAFLRGFWRN
jgi:hypothetical protein